LQISQPASKWIQAYHYERSPRSINASHVLELWLCVRSLFDVSSVTLPEQSCRYSFTPISWILPSEYTKFMRDYYQEREKDASCLFIAKPADLSRGRFDLSACLIPHLSSWF
jgi:hypothetical protein